MRRLVLILLLLNETAVQAADPLLLVRAFRARRCARLVEGFAAQAQSRLAIRYSHRDFPEEVLTELGKLHGWKKVSGRQDKLLNLGGMVQGALRDAVFQDLDLNLGNAEKVREWAMVVASKWLGIPAEGLTQTQIAMGERAVRKRFARLYLSKMRPEGMPSLSFYPEEPGSDSGWAYAYRQEEQRMFWAQGRLASYETKYFSQLARLVTKGGTPATAAMRQEASRWALTQVDSALDNFGRSGLGKKIEKETGRESAGFDGPLLGSDVATTEEALAELRDFELVPKSVRLQLKQHERFLREQGLPPSTVLKGLLDRVSDYIEPASLDIGD